MYEMLLTNLQENPVTVLGGISNQLLGYWTLTLTQRYCLYPSQHIHNYYHLKLIIMTVGLVVVDHLGMYM